MMTDTEMRIAIAEACGWSLIKYRHCVITKENTWLCGLNPNPDEIHEVIDAQSGESRRPTEADYGWESLPDYLNDLNAMHEAEKKISDFAHYARWLKWISLGLRQVPPRDKWKVVHATARQRAEALLHMIGKWGGA